MSRGLSGRLLRVTVAVLSIAFVLDTRSAGYAAEPPQGQREHSEVLIYGATPAGIAAAVAAGKSGNKVLLIEPTNRIGGLVTNGLSHADFRTFEGLTGAFLEFTRRVERYYVEKFGKDSPQVRDCFRGTQGEPHVNLHIFETLLAEHPGITVRKRFVLKQVEVEGEGNDRRIAAVTFSGINGTELTVTAEVFIDATYEGDLMAAAGVEYRVGRESRDTYGESLAPEQADAQVQAYNFRLIATRDPSLRVLPSAPAGYRREDYLALLPLLESGKFKSVFCARTGGIYKAHEPPLPNGKHDVNDVSRGLVRLSLPQLSAHWPDGDRKTREEIFRKQVRHNMGMLYFLQNDPEVPKQFQDEAREWGWCRDEFVENGHVPEQLYVREARRMVGQYVFTEGDTDAAEGDARAVLQPDAIAVGDYSLNCHGTAHEGPMIGGHHTGEFYKGVSPYQVPYGVLVPKTHRNLLVPVACSASHVGFCALRLEPIWTSLGEAAGYAAHLAVRNQQPVQKVSAGKVRTLLHAAGAATIYVSDVLPGSPDFVAVQWWAAKGGLHGVHPAFEKPGLRGAHITSQYYEAYPGHAAELEKPLDEPLRQRWLKLAASRGLSAETLAGASSRGDFIRTAFRLAHPQRGE